jgi:dolichol-phosphate mannosyltransferase
MARQSCLRVVAALFSSALARFMKKQPEISVIIPTYNEAENIPILIPRIAQALKKIPHEIIVADDNSPDGTYKIAQRLAGKFPQLRSICRTHNKGLSPAVLDGFAAAHGKYFVVMDADLQHDEKVLPRFYENFKEGFNLVVGSRKTDGGGIEGWSATRRFISWGASRLAKIFLKGLPSDPMSGYFGISATTYHEIAPDVNPRGFKILLELLARVAKPRIAEVGYIFKPRTHGESKLTGSVMWNYLVALYDLRFGGILPVRYIKYSLVGLAGLAVNQAALFLFKRGFALPDETALLPAIEIALVFNFAVNNLFTFREERLRGASKLIRGLILYQVICTLGAYINYAVALHLSSFLHWNIYLANTAGVIIASFWNYYINAQVIWRK